MMLAATFFNPLRNTFTMQRFWFLFVGVLRRHLAGWLGMALLLSALPAAADTQVRVWHALSAHNQAVFESMVKQFNRRTPDATIKLTGFDSMQALETALDMINEPTDRPHLVQLDEARVPDMTAQRNYLQPLHALLAKHPIGEVQWFLPAANTAGRDSKGRLQAFPFMLEIPVMFYNIARLREAGIQPARPNRDWMKLQSDVAQVANNGTRYCPITSDQPVSINLENLAAVNNQPFITQAGGATQFRFDSLYIRHLSLMVSWVRTELMVKPDFNDVAASRFADGECAVLLSNSSHLGWFNDSRKLRVGVSGLPYYPEVTSEPGLPFVAGSALWATSGHAEADDVATAAFLGWLAKSEQARHWYESTGFLPLTKDAFSQAKSGGKVLAQWISLVEPYANEPVATARGFKIKNYPQIRAIFEQSMGEALAGKRPAVPVLKAASERASEISAK